MFPAWLFYTLWNIFGHVTHVIWTICEVKHIVREPNLVWNFVCDLIDIKKNWGQIIDVSCGAKIRLDVLCIKHASWSSPETQFLASDNRRKLQREAKKCREKLVEDYVILKIYLEENCKKLIKKTLIKLGTGLLELETTKQMLCGDFACKIMNLISIFSRYCMDRFVSVYWGYICLLFWVRAVTVRHGLHQ